MSEVAIKGVRQGILLVLPDDREWDEVLGQLDAKLAAASNLIQGSKAQLDVGDRPVTREQLERLMKQITDGYQLEAVALIGTHDDARGAAEAVGLPVTAAPPPLPPERNKAVVAPDPAALANNALYLRQTVRSGQSIRHDGTIVICGDVNPGAEVIATGDIIVFGTLRGVAHAGAAGDEDCQIIAINLRPTQIRIAGYIARSPDTAAPPLSKYPEVARVQNSEIHIIPLRDM
jgi:septum site-determining protein MinC